MSKAAATELRFSRFGDRTSPDFRRIVIDRDEVGLERAYLDNECPHFFAVDWREDDAEIVADCAEALEIDSLTAEWRDEDLFIAFDGRETRVPLQSGVADRHITLGMRPGRLSTTRCGPAA